MHKYCNIIVDKNMNVLRLIILILSKKDEYKDIKKEKNTLISISGVEKNRTELCKLILYLFTHFCSKSKKEATLEDYINFTNREIRNPQKIRKAIKSLSDLEICYYNNNFKQETEPLFTKVFLKKKIIHFEIGSFFKTKLQFQGAGHRSVSFPSIIFKNLGLKNQKEEKVKFIVYTFLFFYEYSAADINNKKKMKHISLIIKDYFNFDDAHIIKMINEVKLKYLYLI